MGYNGCQVRTNEACTKAGAHNTNTKWPTHQKTATQLEQHEGIPQAHPRGQVACTFTRNK